MRTTVKESKPKHLKNYLLIIAIVILCIIVITLIAKSGNRGMVKVPNFVGQDISSATQTATKSQIFIVEQAKENSETQPIGVIIRQSISSGSLIKKNDTVWVTVSKGRMTNVPRLVGFKKEDASLELQKSGLTLGQVSFANSETIPRGRILNTNPPPEAEIEKGNPVNLVISSGPRFVAPPPPVPSSFVRPAIEFQSLEVQQPDRRGFNLAVGVQITNPNNIPAKVKGFYYKLEVDTFYLGSGTFYCDQSLMANDKTTAFIKVNIRYDRITKAAANLIEKGDVSYKVTGYYILEAQGGRSIEPVATTGRFNIAEKIGPFLKKIFPGGDL